VAGGRSPANVRRRSLRSFAYRLSTSRMSDTTIDAFLRALEADDGDVRFERKLIPMEAGGFWLRPAEASPPITPVSTRSSRSASAYGTRRQGGRVQGCWVRRCRAHGCDGSPACLVFGPGDFEQAHEVDESISIREVAGQPGSRACTRSSSS